MFQRSRHRRLPPVGEYVRGREAAKRTDVERWEEPKADISKCSSHVATTEFGDTFAVATNNDGTCETACRPVYHT